MWHVNIHDIMTGYRAFSRKFVKLFPVMSEGFEIETEMTIHALDKRFVIEEKPIEYSDRKEGESKLNTVSDGFKILRIIFSLFKNYRPLLFFGILAAVLIAISLILFIPVPSKSRDARFFLLIYSLRRIVAQRSLYCQSCVF